MHITIRDYQSEIIEKTFEFLATKKAILIQMPTGTGKTTVFSAIVKRQITQISPRQRVLIIVHRKELVEQIYLRLRSFGILSGIIMSGENYEPDKQVQVASLQTLVRKKELPRNISLIIVDEAHHILASTYLDFLKNYPTSKLIGATATPIRLNGQGFEGVFETLNTSYRLEWFIDNHYLSQFKHLSLNDSGISNIVVDQRRKDYDESSLSSYMSTDKKLADVITAFKLYSLNRKTIVFCVDIRHMISLSEKFKEIQISYATIDSNTPQLEREALIRKFVNNEIKVLLNVNIFTEGFDCPDIETVILARPTKSLALYIQQVGRVLRYKSWNYGLILDCANLIVEHGSILNNQNWSLSESLSTTTSNNNILNNDTQDLKEQSSKISEIQFETLDLVDSYIISDAKESNKLNYRDTIGLLSALSNLEFNAYRCIEDLDYLRIRQILPVLKLKFKSKKQLSNADKRQLKNRAKELYDLLLDAPRKTIVKKQQVSKNTESLTQTLTRRALTKAEIDAIRLEMGDVFSEVL